MDFPDLRKPSNLLYMAVIIFSVITIIIVLNFPVIGYRAPYTMYFTQYPSTAQVGENISFSVFLRTEANIDTTFKHEVLVDENIVLEDTQTLKAQNQDTYRYSIVAPEKGEHRITFRLYDPTRDYDSYGSRARPYDIYFSVQVGGKQA